MKKLVYIAGPYRSDQEWQVWDNIMMARDYAVAVWKAGGVPITPHLLSMLMGGVLPIEEFLEGDCEIIKRCDAFFLVGAWQGSKGALVEKKFAEEKGIPIFMTMTDVKIFLKE